MIDKPTIPAVLGRVFFIAAVVCICVAYIAFQARHIISGPRVTVMGLTSGTLVEEPILTIRGTAHNTVHLSLSDRKIFVNEEGIFAESIPLPSGYSVLTLAAEDKFGRRVVQEFELVRTP